VHGVPPPFRNTSQEDTVVEEAHVLPLGGEGDDDSSVAGDGGFYMLGRTTLGYLAASWTVRKTPFVEPEFYI
jgi:hypothetical protein